MWLGLLHVLLFAEAGAVPGAALVLFVGVLVEHPLHLAGVAS
jgi:hypothetical protein